MDPPREPVILDADKAALAAGLAHAYPLALERSFSGLYGLRVRTLEAALVRAEVAVRDEVRQPMGIVNGGLYGAIAEDLAGFATTAEVFPSQGKAAFAVSNHTSLMRPIHDGTVHAEATRLHRGRTTWVWDVRITDDAGRLCAASRVTMALRDPRPPAA